jgi:hypothetical protein
MKQSQMDGSESTDGGEGTNGNACSLVNFGCLEKGSISSASPPSKPKGLLH